MGLRIQAFILGLGLTFATTVASALGLGEIRVNSTLNQPLAAEIDLLQVRSVSSRDLLVSLGAPEAFRLANVERTPILLDLKFEVDLERAAGPVVRVTSSRVIKEPFLNFLVEARWPSGRMLREYTVLLDLPVFSGARAAPVTATRTQPAAQPSTAQQAQVRPDPPARVSSTRTTAPRQTQTIDGETYGPVRASDTLWNIANNLRPDSSVSVQQTMLAIQRLNPNAFINDNINLLRRGQVLRIPDINEISQLASRDAIREVAEQNRSWNSRDSRYEQEAAQLEGSRNYTATATEDSQPEGRLKLSSRDSASNAEAGGGRGDGEGSGSLENALATTQEELDASRRENSELRDKLKAMEEQVQTMEKLLQVSNEQMRSLELSSAQTNQSEDAVTDETESALDDDAIGEADPASVPAEDDFERGFDRDEQAASADDTTADTEPAVSPDATPAQPVQQPEPSMVDRLMSNILYLAIAAGVLILGIAAFIYKRRERDDYQDDDFDDFEPELVSSDAERAFELDEGDSETLSYSTGSEEPAPEQEEVIAEAETEDVVAECDIHIAYGQYDQAEDKLLRALEQEPDNTAARLKLLEVLSAQNAVGEFDTHYGKVLAAGDTAAIAKAQSYRASLSGIGPYIEPIFDEQSASDAAYSSQSDQLEFETDQNTADDGFDFELSDQDATVVSGTADDPVGSAGSDFLEPDADLALDDTQNVEAFDFELDEQNTDIDMNFDELELDVDMGDLNETDQTTSAQLNSDDLSILAETELLRDIDQPELSEDDSVEFDLASDETIIEGQDDTALDLISTPDSEESLESLSPSQLETSDTDGELPEFEFERGLDEVLNETVPSDTDDLGSLAENFVAQAGGEGLDLEEFDDSGADRSEMAEPDASFDALYDQNDSDATEFELEDLASDAQGPSEAKDFESDVDLDSELNLDELDQELDSLASGLDDDLDSLYEKSGGSQNEPLAPIGGAIDDTSDEQQAGPLAEVDKEIFSGDTLDDTEIDFEDESLDTAEEALDFEIPDFDPEEDDDSNLGFLTDSDETATKLDLARAYIDMGDTDGAKDILDEIMEEGDDTQKREAETLLAKIG